MLRTNLARAVRHLRQARGLRQIDLGARAGVSRQLVLQLECGELARLTVRSIGRVTEALGASVDLTVRWQGAELDRLTDAAHARMAQSTVVKRVRPVTRRASCQLEWRCDVSAGGDASGACSGGVVTVQPTECASCHVEWHNGARRRLRYSPRNSRTRFWKW